MSLGLRMCCWVLPKCLHRARPVCRAGKSQPPMHKLCWHNGSACSASVSRVGEALLPSLCHEERWRNFLWDLQLSSRSQCCSSARGLCQHSCTGTAQPGYLAPGLNPKIPGPGPCPSQGLAVAPSHVTGLSSPAPAVAVCCGQGVLFQKR